MLAGAIRLATGHAGGANCGCDARKNKMNRWGWLGCWRRRDLIAAWLADEAKRRGHEIKGGDALALLRAAFWQLREGARDGK